MEKRRSVCEFVRRITKKWLSGDVDAFSRSENTATVLVGWNESEKVFKSNII